MTAISSINAGSRILASAMQGIAPQCVIKGADQSLTSSTTIQNDNALLTSLVANATYLFDAYLDYEGGTQGSSDIKWAWALPVGATLRYQPGYASTAGAAVSGTSYTGSAIVSAGTSGAGNLHGVSMTGSIIVGSTPGTIQLTWAQNTSSATPTIVHAQSYLALWRIS